MPCESNISNLDQNILFLERKLIENSQLINNLALNFEKLNILTFKRSSSRRSNVFENHVEQNEASIEETGNNLLKGNNNPSYNISASNSAESGQSNSANNFVLENNFPSSNFIPKQFNVFKKPYELPNDLSYLQSSSISTELGSSKTSRAENKRFFIDYWQREILNDFFNKCSQRPTDNDIKHLSCRIKKTEKYVKSWFCNKRNRPTFLKGASNKRINYTKPMNKDQQKRLELFFKDIQSPNREELESLSNAVGLTVIRINNWFVKRRGAARKELKKTNNSTTVKRKDTVRLGKTKFSEFEEAVMEIEFQKCNFPSPDETKRISNDLNRDVLKVNGWFYRRRAKELKNTLEKEPSSKLMKNLRKEPNNKQSSLLNEKDFDQCNTGLVSWNQESFGDDDFFPTRQQTSKSNSDSVQFIGLLGIESNLGRPQLNHVSQHKNMGSSNDNSLTTHKNYQTEQPLHSKCNYFAEENDVSSLLDDLMELIDGEETSVGDKFVLQEQHTSITNRKNHQNKDKQLEMPYFEEQWSQTTKLMSQIVQVFNMEGNKDLVKAYQQADTNSIVGVLLEAINRRSAEMGQEWVNEARKLVQSDSLFPALIETMTVLEEILSVDDSF